MKLWSKGLGKLVLPFFLDRAESVEADEECVIIKGRIVEKKVNWPYIIRLYPEDMVRFTRLMAYDKAVLSYIKSRMGMRFIGFVIANLIKALLITPIVLFEKIFEWIKGTGKKIKQFPAEVKQIPAGEKQVPAGEKQILAGEKQIPAGEKAKIHRDEISPHIAKAEKGR